MTEGSMSTVALALSVVKGQLNMLRCSQCRQEKALTEFYSRGIKCKECIRDKTRQETRRNQEWLMSIKDRPCHDCGRKYPPVVMDFDHVPERGPKLAGVTSIRSRTKALEEIAKCDIVCPTCHRIRTVTRAGLLKREDLYNE